MITGIDQTFMDYYYRIDENSSAYSEVRNNKFKDWPGMLILTDLRLIFLPYRCRSERSLRQRFARLDVNGSGSISFRDLFGDRGAPNEEVNG